MIASKEVARERENPKRAMRQKFERMLAGHRASPRCRRAKKGRRPTDLASSDSKSAVGKILDAVVAAA